MLGHSKKNEPSEGSIYKQLQVMKKRTCGDSPGLVTACPLTPRLYGRARCGVSEVGQVPVLSCIVEEEPRVKDSQLANSITNIMTSMLDWERTCK
jgi:hypothetical protein